MSKYPELNWDAPSITEEFELFRQRMDLCLADNEVTDEEKKALKIKIAIGVEGLRRLNSSGLSAEELKSPTEIWKFLKAQVKTNVNARIHRMELMRYRQKDSENIDEFVTRCRQKGQECQFGGDEMAERIIELIIASTPFELFQKDLLEKPIGFSLKDALQEGRRHEAIAAGRQSLLQMNQQMDALKTKKMSSEKKTCGNCGRSHEFRQCPAYNDVCHGCGGKGHWKKFCRKTRAKMQKKPPKGDTRSVNELQQADEDVLEVGTIAMHGIDQRDEVFTHLHIKGERRPIRLRVKIDTGAQGNTLPVHMFRKMFPHLLNEEGNPQKSATTDKDVTLAAYGGTKIAHHGAIKLSTNHQGNSHEAKFFVVESQGPAILGLPSSRDLRLVTLHCEVTANKAGSIKSVQQLKEEFPQQFDRIGRFPGVYSIKTRKEATPVIHAQRKFPIHVEDELKRELDTMVAQEVIEPVEEPTEWVNSMVVARKNNGSLRICLDPKDLNKAIQRTHHHTPTLEETTHKLAGAKVFSKLDAKHGYWSVMLDDKSSSLTTFNTPFGRYKYRRMPFGLVMSQDVFQQKMDQILEKCPGTASIADDVIVVGKSKQEHDRKLYALMKTAKENGLVFNSEKCVIDAPQVNFFGAVYDRHGVHPDPGKVDAIKNLPAPTGKADLQGFLGLVTYISPFIPKLSDRTAPLRGLLKKDAIYEWSPSHQKAFDEVKESICTETTLQYFDKEKETVIQVDASSTGLGAALLQEGRPIAFASKSLSDTERNYANIEREMLAVVFGCDRFHTYIYGKPFVVESDHKPLQMIQLKNLKAAPPRLQRMLLKIQQYNVTIQYRPGKEMTLADPLSRVPKPDNHHIDLEKAIGMIHFTDERVNEAKNETDKDETLVQLRAVVLKGWPDRMKDLPQSIRPYWSFRDELTVHDGLVLKGDALIVPTTLQKMILAKIHQGHLGIEKSRMKAKNVVYWNKITQDIAEMVRKCSTCMEFARAQSSEPLIPHEVPQRPWETLGTDLFNLEGQIYLIIADYYSKFFIVRQMSQHCSSKGVIKATKEVLSEIGIPRKIISDNGPHFASEAYRTFTSEWEILHVTSSPHYPQSNGFVERTIQTVKRTMKKAKASGDCTDMALLNLRETPISDDLGSPAKLLMGRDLSLRIKTHEPTQKSVPVMDRLKKRQETQKAYHDRGARELPPLQPGQPVRVENPHTRRWDPATVKETCTQPRSYLIENADGATWRRNRKHLRVTHEEQHSGYSPRVRHPTSRSLFPKFRSTFPTSPA